MAADTGTVVLAGTLLTSGGNPVAGATITFTDTNGDTIPSATTDATGAFSVTATVAAPAANETFTASYAGDATHKASTASATGTILVGTTLTLNLTVQ
jgi:uncharacterized protein YfaS (alpha-2-macroglobulin family)